jgi:hypothetical protein
MEAIPHAKDAILHTPRAGILPLALEDILYIPCSVQNTHNFNPAGDRSIKNDVSAKGKTLNPGSQLLPMTSRARLAAKHLHCLVEFIDKGIRIRHAVIRNVAPNLG